MTRIFAFVAAILVSLITVSSACTAGSPDGIRFELSSERGGEIYAGFSGGEGRSNHWTSNFKLSELQGLDLAQLRGGVGGPLRFALVRDPGRLDCAGTGGHSRGNGTCTFTQNADYANFLASRGVKRPTGGEGMALMSLNVRRDLVEALHVARYPVPRIDDLVSLSALGVDGAYIRNLARIGYRPKDLDTLVQLKALGVTPAYIEGFVRNGYGHLPAETLVQLKALDITGDYVASFRAAGYPNLSPDQLTSLKALGVTADYARAVRAGSRDVPTAERLVELKAIGFRPR